MRNCKICNKEFHPEHHSTKMCSIECKKMGRYKSIRKYYERVVVPKLPGPRPIQTEEEKKQKLKEFNNSPERKAYMKNYRNLPGVKDREKESAKRYYLKNRHVEKNGHLKRTFNITLEQYNEMLVMQNNVCAICEKEETKVFKKTGKINDLAVDHCHKTGNIRGLLCWRCNTAIGRFEDSIELLQNAVAYLEKHRNK